ncbi:MAG: hypothetical protein M3203_09920 [Actinomycetota bacterium]|nr:hypothetical protein [Actinomycetota bacterium]
MDGSLTDARTDAPDDPTLRLTPISAPPSRRGYVVAAVLALVGLVVGVGGLVRGFTQLSDTVDRFPRMDVPGSARFDFAAPGDFTLYYESAGAADGVVTVSLPPVQVALTAEQGGQVVSLEEYEGSFDYSVGGRDGTALATFRIDTPGTYVLTADAPVPPGAARLAIGKGLGGALAQTVVPGLFLAGALIAAAVVAIATAVRRRRAANRHRHLAPS